ncbi:hypothetical protein [Cellulomonas composti]|uniref:Uncharacterized protein n=1 Tax=Cellulomonas composti TaxID=266130 RepID=A0A511J6S4_9CELL|nr:hypothetical protein [Cellulomonas composti]GEL93403.1 hypothetical protein CCO02nite_00610 [Cellulomonas composti]
MTVDVQERAAHARLVLARAEQRTGARSIVRPDVEQDRAEVGRAGDVEQDQGTPRVSLLTAERPPLPVPVELAPLLPDGLRRGATTVVAGSTSLVLAVLAAACSGGAWAAVVGQPTLGLLAAAQAGVGLDRLAVVPAPGADCARVLAALLDGMDVVVAGPEARLVDADRRRLSARVRERGAVLLAAQPWPGADTVLTAGPGRWTGVGDGQGRLRTHAVRVTRSGRSSASSPAWVDLTLPLSGEVGTRSTTQKVAQSAAQATVLAAGRPDLRLVG